MKPLILFACFMAVSLELKAAEYDAMWVTKTNRVEFAFIYSKQADLLQILVSRGWDRQLGRPMANRIAAEGTFDLPGGRSCGDRRSASFQAAHSFAATNDRCGMKPVRQCRPAGPALAPR